MSRMKYLYINSNDSKEIFKDNSPFDFTVELSDFLDLTRNWSVALSEIWFDNSRIDQQLNIFSDICDYNHIFDNQLPILRRIYNTSEFINLYFIKLSRSHISTIRIYIRDKNNEIPSIDVSEVNCTLLLKKY